MECLESGADAQASVSLREGSDVSTDAATKSSTQKQDVTAMEGEPPSETDNANYFSEYTYLYHQMDMLKDSQRTGSYNFAITSNMSCFENKIVLDVGAGTCILSIMAARAGAKAVFAVEATDMAVRGRKIVEANGLGKIITVLQGTVETVKLPCKVDIIVSEWMGYFLLRESMLDSVLYARDKFLKPGGALYPSHATLLLAPVGHCNLLRDKFCSWQEEGQNWSKFNDEMLSWYETDFSCVREEFMAEQRKYCLLTGTFVNLTPKSLIGPAKPLLELDLSRLTLEELTNPTEPCKCSMRIQRDGPIDGFCGYFDAFFQGSSECPVENPITLTTSPTVGTATHWGQQLLGFYPPFQGSRGDILECSMFIRRQERNHRLLWLETEFLLCSGTGGERVVKDKRQENYFID
eukprot:TRINITY_DN69002_c0_g1_i1.p1 TRINITY_DN69002_c0_g1~~TRINITY_DN69002_c0_g1_i1.p1  ORF type:complete len:407 (+),score=78.95 TRINITY_DN69002_c0_g1_i1:118-1338(+)